MNKLKNKQTKPLNKTPKKHHLKKKEIACSFQIP